MMRLSGNRSDGSGCYGYYYRLKNGRGIKVICDNNVNDGSLVAGAKEEFKHLKMAYKCRHALFERIGIRIPKPIKFTYVDLDGDRYPAIVMEHIQGNSLDQYDEDLMGEADRYFHDSHSDNFIRCRWTDDVYRIDFGCAPTKRLMSLYRTLT
jgi:hypothetical protein